MSRSIGKGTFGKVRLGVHIPLGEKVAVKILEKDKIRTRGDSERVAREIKILKQVNHPHIVQLYEIIETPRQVLLAMELAEGGELFTYIVTKHRLSEHESCKYLHQILSGLEYLQQLRIVHRDLKPENLLLDHKKNIKIVDFGLSNFYTQNEMLKTACGSPCYAAPEMIAGKRYLGAQVDIWSCGVILYAMLCGYLPFEDPNTSNLYKKIMAGDFRLPNWLGTEASDLVKKILVTDPEKRYTIDKIKSHPWFIKHTTVLDVYSMEKSDPIENLFNHLSTFGLNGAQIRECVMNGKNNSGTAVYKILANMHKQGKKIPDSFKVKKSHNASEVPNDYNKTDPRSNNNSADRSSIKSFKYGTSASPVNYRPITSYAIPPSLLPSSIQRQYKKQSPKVKTPVNYVFEVSNPLNFYTRNRSPRLGTTYEPRRRREVY